MLLVALQVCSNEVLLAGKTLYSLCGMKNLLIQKKLLNSVIYMTLAGIKFLIIEVP